MRKIELSAMEATKCKNTQAPGDALLSVDVQNTCHVNTIVDTQDICMSDSFSR